MKANPWLGNLDAMLRGLFCHGHLQRAGPGQESAGLHGTKSKVQPEVQVALLGCVRPKFPPGGGGNRTERLVQSGGHYLHAVLYGSWNQPGKLVQVLPFDRPYIGHVPNKARGHYEEVGEFSLVCGTPNKETATTTEQTPDLQEIHGDSKFGSSCLFQHKCDSCGE